VHAGDLLVQSAALDARRLPHPWSLSGYTTSQAKVPYASRLFGDTPQATLEAALLSRRQGFRAAKFGWGPIGQGGVREDADHFAAAREGLGRGGILLVDAGQIFIEDVARAAERLPALEAADAT
jgi:L-alanine-DL-glutamate epimerase-like enolase superfamily enzyme